MSNLATNMTTFTARSVVLGITGVDPMPLKTRFLPYYRRLPRPLAIGGLAAATALSLPIDALFGRRLVNPSWHKVLVFEPAPEHSHAG